MKKLNRKRLHIALWLELLLAYVLPFRTSSDTMATIGFPFAFLTVPDKPLHVSLFQSMHLNPFVFLINALLLYWLITLVMTLYHKWKS